MLWKNENQNLLQVFFNISNSLCIISPTSPNSYPECLHKEGGCLDAEVARSIEVVAEIAPIYTMHEALMGYWPWGWGGATSQLDLPSLTPLSVAVCGWLQLGVPHWSTSVDYCKYLTIDPPFCGSRLYTGRLLAIENFTFTFFLDIYSNFPSTHY